MTGAPCCYRGGVNGGGVVAVAAPLWHGKESWNALLLTLTGGLTLAPICLVFWHYLANNTAAARSVTGFSANQLARATSGLVLAAVCYQSLAPVGIAGRTVALYAILSGAADYRAGGTMVGKGR